MSETWWDYVQRTAGYVEQKVIAGTVGVHGSSITAWKRGESVSADNAIAFARAYKRPPVEALVAARYLTESDAADVIEVERGIRDVANDELLAEVRRRMRRPDNSQPGRTSLSRLERVNRDAQRLGVKQADQGNDKGR